MNICSPSYTIRLAICILILAAAANFGYAQEKSGLTSLEMVTMKRVQQALITPRGNRIIYTLSLPADPLVNNKAPSHYLYVLDLLSGDSTPFVTTMSVSQVSLRPNHGSITFIACRGDEKVNSLFEISLSGGEARKLFSFKTPIMSYDWGPKGNMLAFTAADPGSIPTDKSYYQPEIYEENAIPRRGYITNVTQKRQIIHQLLLEGSVFKIRWDPAGEKIAVAVAPSTIMDDEYLHQKVLILDKEGGLVLSRVEHQGKLGQFAWSPNGDYLAMIAGSDKTDPVAGRLFIVSADGGKPNNLQPDFPGMFTHFQWLDNDTISYVGVKGVWSTYGTIRKDGTQMNTILNSGQPYLQSFSVSATGATVFVADTPRHPEEVYILKKGATKPLRLTNHNPFLHNTLLGTQEVVTWKTADSLSLEGLLVYPVHYIKGMSYPLITVAHGGPEEHFHNGWLTDYANPGQVAAAKGFFVFYPNYRGSSGKGEAFAKSSQGDPAGDEFDDIISGVDQLVSVGITDSNKVGITGASYGGYATAWLSTKYTDRFTAGVMYAGITDNISRWGTTDIPHELTMMHNRRPVSRDFEFFLKRSPIYYAGQTKTPLLIMAGEDDKRVDPGQSYELYRYIKSQTNTPVRLVLYPGEGHGNSRAGSQLDYSLRMFRWFEHFLKGEKQKNLPNIDTAGKKSVSN